MMREKYIAPEVMAEARRLYEETLAPVEDIRAMMGLACASFYRRVHNLGWRRRRAHAGKSEFARSLTGSAVAKLLTSSADLLPADLPPADLPPADLPLADLPRAHLVANAEPLSPQQKNALAQHLMAATRDVLDAVQRVIVNITPGDLIANDHCARTLASVSRSLCDIAALNKPDEVTPPDDADDDPVPRDIDEFRNELARRIRGFLEARRAGPAGIPAQPEAALE
jgi:hypothetical protein